MCLLSIVQELRSMAKIQDKVMNEKSRESVSVQGRSKLPETFFSSVRDYKRESTENRGFVSQTE